MGVLNVFAGWTASIGRRLASLAPPPVGTSDQHERWLAEQMREYTVSQLFAAPVGTPGLNLSGETWELRQAYRNYAFKEPAVKAPLKKKALSVAHLDPVVLPEDANSPADKEAAQFVDYAIRTSKGGWPAVLKALLLPSLIDGFALAEKVLRACPRGKWAGKWVLEELASRDTEHVRFHLDPYRRIASIRNLANGQSMVEFRPEDFVVYAHDAMFRSPFGVSDLRAAYRACRLIEASIKLRAMMLENFSGPFLKLKRSDTSKVEQAKKVLANARAMGYIVLGPEDELEVLNLATAAPDQFQACIEDLRKEAGLAIAGSYLQALESKTPQGDSAEHADTAEILEWDLATTAATALTEQLVDDLVTPNFGRQVGRPRIQLGAVDVRKVIQEGMRIEAAQNIGLQISAEYAREVMGVEAPRHAGDVLVPPGKGGFGPPADPIPDRSPAPGENNPASGE